MAVKILVASPIISFGELVRSTLASHGNFQVMVCETGDQVLDAMTGDIFDVLILDAAISDQPFAPLVQKIIACVPDQKIAIIPPENKPDHPLLEDVPAHGFLFRPFLDPDLLNLVQRLAAAAEEDRKNQIGGRPGSFLENKNRILWSKDPSAASSEMSRLLLSSSALAGLVIHNGELYVHAGRISAEASQEIKQMLSQVKNDSEKDLVRFTFLVADDCEALVYAVSLVSDWTLALVYDVSMPLTRVRSQATAFAAHLREEIPLEDLMESQTAIELAPIVEANEPEAEESPEEESDPVDISDIMREINSGEDLSGDEFLNLTSIDDELFSLINEVNAPEETEEKGKEETAVGEKPVVIDKIYTRPLKLPESMAAEADVRDSPAAEDESAYAAEKEIPLLQPSVEITDSPEEQEAFPVGESDEGGISAEDALGMAAALSQLEENMGVVVGENIPLIETPPAEERPSPEETGSEAAGFQTFDEFQEPAEEQTTPDVAPTTEQPAFAEEFPLETVEPAVDTSAEVPSGRLERESPMPSEPEVIEPLAEEIREVQTSPDEEEIPAAIVSDTRPTPVTELERDAGESQVEEVVRETSEISPIAAAIPEDEGESIYKRKGYIPSGDQLYSVVFAPRQSGQFLTGELVDLLGNLLKTTVAGFPWRLTGVAIRPDYLRLSIEISQFLEPSEIITFIKEYTDNGINKKIPRTDEEINAKPFWAEGYLSIPDHSIPEGDQLHEFLQSVKTNPVNPV
ncbi:MAG: transposase [Anaerolineaceae bacterium]